ncbi:GntR family transcriptional regulator [Martelella soudanensis]|uniref:GntR family transcriptional regulator n=2 Tax=unclassified Martelella TaxID=2629616 RepID=UPI001FF015B6|nr:GntR family transcriptional regulator [Martelella sp. NC20]
MKMTQPEPISRANLSEQLYQRLRQGLMDGQYHPGQRLTISELAKQHGTSSTPVREAMFRLVSERALEIKAATSVFVPKLTPRDLREIISIRIDLEGMAAYRCAEICTPADIAELEDINRHFIQAAAEDPEAASRINRNFHFKILQLAEMPFVESICETMWTLMGPFLRTFHEEVPARQLSADNHRHFPALEAMRRSDADAARAAMQDDIRWGITLVDRQYGTEQTES